MLGVSLFRSPNLQWTLSAAIPLMFLALSRPYPAPAQTVTTTITSSGLGTTVVPPSGGSSTTAIRGGTLSSNGANLFHSFGEFSIAGGETAAFQNLNAGGTAPLVEQAASVSNIIGRVTGTNPSNIYGTIDARSGFPTANLFLINPHGIVFGPGAALDVGGAVHFSTADYLRLGTGNEFFFADLAKNSTLSSAPVTAFGFLGAAPIGSEGIRLSSGASLTLDANQDISLVGRDTMNGSEPIPGIRMDEGSSIDSPGGRSGLVSVGTPLDPVAGGEVHALDLSPAAASSGHGFASLGHIFMTGNSRVSVSHTAGPAVGDIVIRGGRLTMEHDSRILARTTDVNTARGGIDIDVADAAILRGASSIDSETVGNAALAGGDITIRAGSLTLTEGSRITAISGSGHPSASGGDITIHAGAVTLSGAIDGGGRTVQSGLFSGTTRTSSGTGGRIRVSTDQLAVLDGAAIDTSTFSDAVAGEIQITASSVLVSGVNTTNGVTTPSSTITSKATWDRQADNPNQEQQNTGNGGSIRIQTASFEIRDGGQLNTSSETAANAGTIDIAANTVTIAGGHGVLRSGIFTESSGSGSNSGSGGNLRLTATTVLDLSSGATIALDTSGAGAAGSLTVNAGTVNLSSGAQVTSGTISSGAAGNLSLTAGSLLVQDSAVSTRSVGSGNAGTIAITADTLMVSGPTARIDSSTSTNAQNAGSGGNIAVSATNHLTVHQGSITTSTASSGRAGTVQVTADQVVLSGGGSIRSSTTHSGHSGTVSVTGSGPMGVVQLSGGTIQASTTGSGQAGNIIVSGNAVTLEGATSTIDSTSTGSGNAGSIVVQAGNLQVNAGATISSASIAPGTGNAGSVSIYAIDQFQSTGGRVSTAADIGRGGDITIQAEDIALTSGAAVLASTTGPLDAGDITLVAGDQILLQDGTVTTSASRASGGNITLLAPNLIQLNSGRIISSVQGGPATSGGDITIDPQAVVLQNNSQILAQAFQGNGGNISITAGVLIVDPSSRIDATSQMGISGQVSLQAPIQNLAGVVMPLPESFVTNADLYGQRCAAQKNGQFSSLVQGTRDGVPPQPGDLLSSPLPFNLSLATTSGVERQVSPPTAFRPAHGDAFSDNAHDVPFFSGCRS